MNPLALDLHTRLFVRRLASGRCTVAPVAELDQVAYGPMVDALTEQQVFLAELLASVAPERLSRHNLPDTVTLVEVRVPITREDLPRRVQLKHPFTVPCLVVPAPESTTASQGATPARPDRWVTVAPMQHTFYLRGDEDLEKAVTHEVQRLVGALEMNAWQLLSLLPARSHELVAVDVPVERAERLPADKVASLRKRVQEQERRQWALEVLTSVAIPLHARLPRKPAPLSGRAQELTRLTGLLGDRRRLAVVLTGASLAGKSALLHAWIVARRGETSPPMVWSTSGAQLVAGMSGLGQWQERVRRVFEAAEVLDAVLHFDNLGDLLSEHAGSHVDLPAAIKPWIEDGRVRVVAELRDEQLDAAERHHGAFMAGFTRLRVEAFDAPRSADALRERVRFEAQHRPQQVRLRDDAVATLVDLAERYLPYQAFPGKVFRLYDELRTLRENDRGVITGAQVDTIDSATVQELFSARTGIPAFLLRDDRALKLDDVVASLERSLVGQRAAVRRVAETVCVVKARLQPAGRPLATLLFIGPTGVGKTELARSLAKLLFGSEDRLVRFDMSEFTDLEAADRLLRGARGQDGLLTRRVREQPFCVLLLDEIEKAHPAVFDLLLQVCGEGRLTDGRGRTAYFHNAIVIMTSNLGASSKRESMGFSPAAVDDAAFYAREVDRHFRPEFVNRLDRIVAFSALSRDEIRAVARMAVARVSSRRGIADAGVALTVSDGALDRLAEDGYSARYGARALRRHVEDHLVTPLAQLALQHVTPWGAVHVTAHGEPTPRWKGAAPAVITQAGPLALHGFAREHRGGDADHAPAHRISMLRLHADRLADAHRVTAARERLAHLRAQLDHGASATKQDARGSVEIRELQTEHHHVEGVVSRLDTALRELYTIEEVAVLASLEGASAQEFVAEAEAARVRFDRALLEVLLVDEKRHRGIAVLAAELDDGHPLERWLERLDEVATANEWSVTVHRLGEPARHGEVWPAARRWGPPRTLREVREDLDVKERDPAQVIALVSGGLSPWLLALESGLHRWLRPHVGEELRAHVLTRTLSMRSSITEKGWEHRAAMPVPMAQFDALRREAPVRTYQIEQQVAWGRMATDRVPAVDQGAAMQSVALRDLLWFEGTEGADQDRESLFEAPLDGGLQ